MKWILAAALALAVLVSGCTETGQVAAGEEEGACRIVNETYVEIDSLDAGILGVNRQISWSQDLGYYAEGIVKLKNTDNESGWFLVTFNWMGPGQERPYTEKKSMHLNPGDSGEFKSVFPNIDPQLGVSFLYEYESYPDSQRIVKKQRETKICD